MNFHSTRYRINGSRCRILPCRGSRCLVRTTPWRSPNPRPRYPRRDRHAGKHRCVGNGSAHRGPTDHGIWPPGLPHGGPPIRPDERGRSHVRWASSPICCSSRRTCPRSLRTVQTRTGTSHQSRVVRRHRHGSMRTRASTLYPDFCCRPHPRLDSEHPRTSQRPENYPPISSLHRAPSPTTSSDRMTPATRRKQRKLWCAEGSSIGRLIADVSSGRRKPSGVVSRARLLIRRPLATARR